VEVELKLFTIGIRGRSALEFFSKLSLKNVMRVIDVRFSNESQLCGFQKSDDLRYLLYSCSRIRLVEVPDLLPTKNIYKVYKRRKSWNRYERLYRDLLSNRNLEGRICRPVLNQSCLIGDEPNSDFCHRRVIAEYLSDYWGDIDIEHL
jgi:uncharacterized protein (DUF488 family)